MQLLGQVAVESIVKLNENGAAVNYVVVHQGKPSSIYDDSCDGTWLLRQDIAENRMWDSGDSNVLENSDIQPYLNNTWINRYDTDIRNAIKQVKIPYRQNGGSGGTDRNGANGLSCKIFLLSGKEVGWDSSESQYFPNDGAKLSYFLDGIGSSANQKRVATLNGIASYWWLRSPYTYDTILVWYVRLDGVHHSWHADTPCGVRPALILPDNLFVDENNNVIVNLPITLTVPQMLMQGQQATVNWTAIEGADSYTLQRKANTDTDWVQVYSGANTTFSETAGTWTTVQYRVQAVFDGTPGGWATSAEIPVVSASALVISGQDGDLGTLVNDVPYTISTDTGNQITATISVNSVQVASDTVQNGFAYNIPVMDLPTGEGTIVISASVNTSAGSPVTATRTWTYTKTEFSFPNVGSTAQLTLQGENVFPATLAECVRVGANLGGDLGHALEMIAPFIVNGARIETGSYVGTGTYGESNPNKIVSSFTPRLSLILTQNTATSTTFIVFVQQIGFSLYWNGNSISIKNNTFVPESENELSWYSTDATVQGNLSGKTYEYILLG